MPRVLKMGALMALCLLMGISLAFRTALWAKSPQSILLGTPLTHFEMQITQISIDEFKQILVDQLLLPLADHLRLSISQLEEWKLNPLRPEFKNLRGTDFGAAQELIDLIKKALRLRFAREATMKIEQQTYQDYLIRKIDAKLAQMKASESSSQNTIESSSEILANREIHVGSPIKALSMSPDGKLFAVATETAGVRIYSFPSGRLIRELPFDESTYFSVDFHPSENILAVSRRSQLYYKGGIEIWDLRNPRAKRDLIHPEVAYSRLAYSRDGTRLAAVTSLGDLHVYQGHDRVVDYRGVVDAFTWGLRSDQIFVSVNQDLKLWTPNEVKSVKSGPSKWNILTDLSLAPSGSSLVSAGSIDAGFWDLLSWKPPIDASRSVLHRPIFDLPSFNQQFNATLESPIGFFSCAFAPRGDQFFLGSNYHHGFMGTASASASGAGPRFTGIARHEGNAIRGVFSRDGLALLTGSSNGKVKIHVLPLPEIPHFGPQAGPFPSSGPPSSTCHKFLKKIGYRGP